ncbi:hypothetical protein [Flavobacterium sp. C4GT6]|uniref:hypothetical protein n=1 Tax=Flavobacterium sp. C4GT6 TaxID=3103818 RepID=UPI002ED16C3F
MKKQPEFPLLDVSVKNWNSEEILGLIEYSAIMPGVSQKVFEECHLNRVLVDGNGYVFKITGKELIAAWRKFVPFFVPVHRYVFDYQNRKMSFDEVKEYMVNGLNSLDNKEGEDNTNLKDRLNQCHTIRDIIKQYSISW